MDLFRLSISEILFCLSWSLLMCKHFYVFMRVCMIVDGVPHQDYGVPVPAAVSWTRVYWILLWDVPLKIATDACSDRSLSPETSRLSTLTCHSTHRACCALWLCLCVWCSVCVDVHADGCKGWTSRGFCQKEEFLSKEKNLQYLVRTTSEVSLKQRPLGHGPAPVHGSFVTGPPRKIK